MSESSSTPLRRLQVRSLHSHGRKQRNADRWLEAFDRSYALHTRPRRETLALMAHEGDNDGRGQVAHAPSSVNATEVRYSARWFGRRDESKDYACYRIDPVTGARTLIDTGDESATVEASRPTKTDAGGNYAARLALLGNTQADND